MERQVVVLTTTTLCYRSVMFADEFQSNNSSHQPAAWGTSTRSVAWVMALSFGALMFEGYDVVVYGAAVPALLAYKPWALNATQVGSIGSATLFGMFFGAPAAGWLSDRFGRRRVFVALLAFFSCMMFLAALAPSPLWLGIFRFLAGLGFGGVPPTTVSLVNEAAPANRKILFSGGVLTGVGCGGIVAAIMASFILRRYGFRGLFTMGTLPLITLVPLAAWLMPKSLDRQTAPPVIPGRETETGRYREASGRLTRLTLIFTAIYLFSLMVGGGLLTWLPQLLHSRGLTMEAALHSLLPLNVGTIVGALLGVWLADRVGGRAVIAGMYAVGAVSLAMIALHTSQVVTTLFLFSAGAAVGGVQCVLPSFMATLYPPNLRATAVGTASGLGRLGGAAGPFLAGALISARVGQTGVLFAFVTADVIAGSFAFLLPRNGIGRYDG